MSDTSERNTAIYRVVVNHEEQYSIWPEGKVIPAGWREAGRQGSKDECLAYIKRRLDGHAALIVFAKKMEDLSGT